MNIGFLASGKIGFKTLQKCFDLVPPLFIGTDGKSEEIILLAREKNIPLFMGNPRGGKLLTFLVEKEIKCQYVFSVNYLFLLENDIISHIPQIINIHGSLLPKYRGRTPHVWAIINNEQETGITAHEIDEGCDTGKIVYQETIQIGPDDTGNDVLQKFEERYPVIIEKLINELNLGGLLRRKKQDEEKATFFGKRTPEDGLIDWSWQKERIRNWVRALAYPYPGAFSYIDGQKVVIDKISYSDYGFNEHLPNGQILSRSPMIVKTPNGTVELVEVRTNSELLSKNKIFNYEDRQ